MGSGGRRFSKGKVQTAHVPKGLKQGLAEEAEGVGVRREVEIRLDRERTSEKKNKQKHGKIL